jgi:hypothetical protein
MIPGSRELFNHRCKRSISALCAANRPRYCRMRLPGSKLGSSRVMYPARSKN